jgi:integrase
MAEEEGEMSKGVWAKPVSLRGVYLRGKVWYVRYKQGGKLKIERSGFVLSDALTLYKKRKGEADDLAHHPERARAGILFDELMKDVIASSRKKYEQKYPDRTFKPGRLAIVAKWFEGRKVVTITTDEIQRVIDEHTQTAATSNRFRSTMSKIFRAAVRSGKAEKNLATDVERVKENNSVCRYLNQYQPDEEDRLRVAIRKSRYPQREAEFDLALSTGMRQQELYQLTWKNVDLLRKQVTIPQSKANRREYVALNALALKSLAKLRALYPKAELVAPLGYSSAHRRWWLSVRKAVGSNDLRWHDLRHTFASRLVMAGVDIFTVSKLLRHANVSMTQRYAHLSSGHLLDAVAKLDAPTPVIQTGLTTRELVQ